MISSDRSKVRELIAKASKLLDSNPSIELYQQLSYEHTEFILRSLFPGSQLSQQYPEATPVYEHIHQHFIKTFKLPINSIWTGSAIFIPADSLLEAHRLKQKFFELGLVRFRTVHCSVNGCDAQLFLRIDASCHFTKDPLMASQKSYFYLLDQGLKPDFVVTTQHAQGNTVAEFSLTLDNVLAVSKYIENCEALPKPYLACSSSDALDAFTMVIPSSEASNFKSRGLSLNSLRNMVSDYCVEILPHDHFQTSSTGQNSFTDTISRLKTKATIY